MKRKTAKDFDPNILKLFDGYVHGDMTKRDFLRGAGKYLAAGVTATAVLESLQPNYALAEQVAPDDPSIETMRVTYDSTDRSAVSWRNPLVQRTSCLPSL